MGKFDIEEYLAAIADIAKGTEVSQPAAESGISPQLIVARGMMFTAIKDLADAACAAISENEP
jgi:hypothetical protein